MQGTLHLEVARPRPSLAVEHPLERRVLSILSIILVLLVASYLYFVTASILHVMARAEADAQSQQIESDIGSLEEQYFALSQSVSPQEAQTLGLAPVEGTSYVYRPGNAAVGNSSTDQI